jgi:hypothetical protein
MSEDTPIVLSFKDALDTLETFSKNSFKSEVWVPSLKRNITIKEINAKQQKELLESAIDSSVYKSSFSKTFYNILSSNTTETKDVLDSLNLADKTAIAIGLRNQISPTIKVNFKDEENEEVSLKPLLDKILAYNTPEPITFDIDKNGVSISVTVTLPSIISEMHFDAFLLKNKKKTDDIEEVKILITDAFLSETAKYIKSIFIDSQNLNFESFSIHQKIQFVEKLPATIIQQIIDIITKWKKELEGLLTVNSPDNKNIKTLEVDSLLFLTN